MLTTDQANSFASMLRLFETMSENESDQATIVADKSREAEYNRQTNTNLDEEAELVELRYIIEKDFMYAVEQGNKTEALNLINSGNLLFSFSERFPNQPIRRMKNNLIVMNTMLRIAARNSNVPTILIHRISEKYALQIENSSKLATLNQLHDNMIAAYCDLVSESALRHYSKTIQIAIEHIQTYYDQQLNMVEIAKACNTHPSHLSRSFKKETNMTITAYQQMLRMNRAKYLLETEPLTIEEIAWIVGYEDSSYFARVFKKETGSTPTAYRQGI
ncbi:AraC family transcriptional regulator [Oceanobacillus sp. 143]|nr:AraC family transcriptional regulator [Oceanobacillus sp. 143]